MATAPSSLRSTLLAALGLACASAVALGMARFSYALLLPAMRADLGWSYFTAGAMNTANAAGYLLGALCMPWLLRRFDARTVLLAGGFFAAGLMALHGPVRSDWLLLILRCATGVASAASFVTGGLLAARLASALPVAASTTTFDMTHIAKPHIISPGLVLGLYYGGTGLGIIASTLLVPPWPWPVAWVALGGACLLATVATAFSTRALRQPPSGQAQQNSAAWWPLMRAFGWGLAGYAGFGLGYIGYMTFAITLLREQGLASAWQQGFYALLGVGVLVSSWLWAGLLQRWRGGQTMSLLNGLLALATLLPVVSTHVAVVLISGALFGAVSLTVVASTTALVRHNLPGAQWPAGITLFTVVFAAGQIVGPVLVGAVADGAGGLQRGFVISAALLALGSLCASRQRALA
jgi:predicted MFS family arabinose efflux permease